MGLKAQVSLFSVSMKSLWGSFILKDTVGAHYLLISSSVLYSIHFPAISPSLLWRLTLMLQTQNLDGGFHFHVYCYQPLEVSNYTN